MNNTTLNRAYLESLNACPDAIDFVERNNLVGFPLDRLDEVEGDYGEYVQWLKKGLSTRREYDSNGNMTLRVNPDGDEYRYEYDSNGNKTLEVDPDGSECRYEYDSNGNMTLMVDPDGDECRYEYDSNGNKTLLVYPNGSETRYEYDSNGNKTLEVDPDGSEVSTLTNYYDNGQLKSIDDLLIPQF